MKENTVLVSTYLKSLGCRLISIRIYTSVCYGETEHRFPCAEVRYETNDGELRVAKLRPLRHGTMGEVFAVLDSQPDDLLITSPSYPTALEPPFWVAVLAHDTQISLSGEVMDYDS